MEIKTMITLDSLLIITNLLFLIARLDLFLSLKSQNVRERDYDYNLLLTKISKIPKVAQITAEVARFPFPLW